MEPLFLSVLVRGGDYLVDLLVTLGQNIEFLIFIFIWVKNILKIDILAYF